MRLGQGLQALDPALPLFLHLPPALAMPQGLALTPVQTLPQGLALTPGLGTWLPQPQPANFLVGGWQAGFINPRTWGLGRRRSHEYVMREGCSRQSDQLHNSRNPASGQAGLSKRPAI